MKYQSTRALSDRKTGTQAIVAGLAAGGGLYVPEQVPALPEGFLKSLLPVD